MGRSVDGVGGEGQRRNVDIVLYWIVLSNLLDSEWTRGVEMLLCQCIGHGLRINIITKGQLLCGAAGLGPQGSETLWVPYCLA